MIKKRSPLWYELPLFLSIVGGVIAYLIIRKDDPKKARNCLILSIIPIVIIFAMSLGFMIFFGLDNPFYVVASGSMMPELQVYDLMVVQSHTSFEEIQVGDIIVFNRPSGHDRAIAHRVVSIVDEDPKTLRTKGDNNVASIPETDFPITEKEFIGKVEHVVPQFGHVTQLIKPPFGYLLSVPVHIVPVILHFKFKREQKEKESQEGD